MKNLNCAETHAGFRVVGDSVDPAKLTERLRIHPSAATVKGQPNPLLHSPGGVPSRTGYWMLSSEGSVQSNDLEAHLTYLLDQLEPARRAIAALSNSPEFRVEFHCYWMSETGHGGPVLSAEVLRRIADMGAELEFDVYFAGE
jgi:hypothetical protein